MNENSLRWKARIGSLKPLALIIIVVGAIAMFALASQLSIALNNSAKPQPVKIEQIVKGEIGSDRYVQVAGTAEYKARYQETENDRPVADYYFLVDYDAGHMILVKPSELVPEALDEEDVIVSGMTHTTDSDLRKLVESDMPDFRTNELQTTATLYIGKDERPANLTAVAVPIAIVGVLMVLSLATFVFPGVAFAPRPIDPMTAPIAGSTGIQATGRFQKVDSVNPSIKLGRSTRQFNNAVSNIVPLEDRRLMVMIHYVLTTRVYGIAVKKQQSDWAVIFDTANVIDIEPGQVLGWRDRLAVRLRYKDAQEKQRTLIVSFKQAGTQAAFVNLLRQLGFAVGSGEPSLI